MDAVEVLAGLCSRGFTLSVEGDGIRVTPASKLTPADREAIRRRKGELRTLLLHPELDVDERERFGERASIGEFLGKLSRAEAEEMAFAEVVMARKQGETLRQDGNVAVLPGTGSQAFVMDGYKHTRDGPRWRIDTPRGDIYFVNVSCTPWKCSCPAFRFHQRCKHIDALAAKTDRC